MSTPSNQVEAVVDAALDLPVAERAAYLDKVCGDNPPLRQLVEALLRAHGHAPASGSPRPPAREATAASTTPLCEKPGDKIGPYKLLQQIGEGGCGVVYMAEQEAPVRRRVALKVIKLGMDTKKVIARFEAERQALALMDHPNIAKVLEAGASETGRPYFVMELVRGIKITDYCDQNNLPTEARLELFIQVCKAVQHAHQKGVIHRDIKPSNILVTLHDGVPVPKVIDFGIAKATEQRLTDKTLFTALEQFIGTPAYMSPEQAEMSGLDIDTRSDIYSLGVLLYELLTGQMPFNPKALMKAGLDEMRRIIREQDPVRPSTRLSSLDAADQTTVARRRQVAVPKLLHLVRGDLDWIVMKCLEKDRTRRYETANGLARDIERHLGNEPVVACPPNAAYRFQKLVRRNKLIFAAGGAVAAALVLGLVGVIWEWQQAQANAKEAQKEAAKSTQVTQLLKEMLDGVGPSKAKGRDTMMLKEILDKTAKRVGKELTKQPGVQADLQTTIGNVYAALGDSKEAEAMHREALQTRQSLFGREHQDVAASLNNLASVLFMEGNAAGSEAAAREALAMQRKLLPQNHPDIAESLNNLATAIFQEGEFSQGIAFQREAVAIITKADGEEHPKVAALLDNLGTMLREKGQLQEAEAAHRKSLAILRKAPGNEDLATASALRNLANVLRYEGRLPEAEAVQREALEEYHKLRLYKHPDVADTLNDLANILGPQGKLQEAETNLYESIAISQALSGAESLNVATSLDNLGTFLQQEQRFADAEAKHREALRISRKILGDEAPDVLSALKNLTVALWRQGKLTEAEALAREALAIREKRWPDDWKTFNNQRELGTVLMDQKRFADAEPLLLSCYEGLKRQEASLIPRAKVNLTNTCVQIIKLYKAWDKPEQAEHWRAILGQPNMETTTPK